MVRVVTLTVNPVDNHLPDTYPSGMSDDDKTDKRRVVCDLDAEDAGLLKLVQGHMKLSTSDTLRILIRERASEIEAKAGATNAA